MCAFVRWRSSKRDLCLITDQVEFTSIKQMDSDTCYQVAPFYVPCYYECMQVSTELEKSLSRFSRFKQIQPYFDRKSSMIYIYYPLYNVLSP